MIFKNREEAAAILAHKLMAYTSDNPLIIAIPRGGVSMAHIIAYKLAAHLDIILIHKLFHPDDAHQVIGSVDEDGQIYLDNNSYIRDIPLRYLESEREACWHELSKKRTLYTPLRPAYDPAHRTVIIVDDGLITGHTLKTVLITLKEKKPKKIIAALGVGSACAITQINPHTNETVCLVNTPEIKPLNYFYEDFTLPCDNALKALLEQ